MDEVKGLSIVAGGKTYDNVPSVKFRNPEGGISSFSQVSGSVSFTPSLEAQSADVSSYATASIGAITKELLAQLDEDFVAHNIKKDVDIFGLIGTFEGDGNNTGDSWTSVYDIFRTGTFTPTSDATSQSIDTGVEYSNAGGTDYRLQTLVVWREPDGEPITGFWYGAKGSFTKTLPSSGTVYTGCAVGNNNGAPILRPFMQTTNAFPSEGETIWTISNLLATTAFQSGKTYRWILLGVLK